MIIRRYQPGEEIAIWDVYFRATHESNARDYHPDLLRKWAPPDQDMDRWRDRIVDKNPFVAVINDHVVGMAELEESGFIDYFYVLPDFQGQGIGSNLLSAIETEAKSIGVFELIADVSITAKDFFFSHGFHIVEARSNLIIGHPAPNFSMSKTMKSEQDAAANP